MIPPPRPEGASPTHAGGAFPRYAGGAGAVNGLPWDTCTKEQVISHIADTGVKLSLYEYTYIIYTYFIYKERAVKRYRVWESGMYWPPKKLRGHEKMGLLGLKWRKVLGECGINVK